MFLYRDILKQSFGVIWRNKYLWFFGFFAAFLGSFLELEFLFNKMDSTFIQRFINNLKSLKETGILSGQVFSNFINLFKTEPISMSIMVVIFLIILVLFAFLIWLSVVSQIGLVNNSAGTLKTKTEEKNKLGIQEGVEAGIKSFWPVFFINLLVKAFIYIIFLCLSFLMFYIAYQSSLEIKIVLLNIVLFVLFIPLALILGFIAKYAICYVVIEKNNFSQAVKKAFDLFLKNWLVSIEMAFIIFIISFFVSLGILLASFIISLPILLLLNLSLLYSAAMLSFWIFILGMLILSVFVAVTGAALSAFRITAWTDFFLKLNSSQGVLSKLLRLTSFLKK